MASDSNCNTLLRQVDATAVSIQRAAAAMMKHYDGAEMAVTAWRNALTSASPTHLLPLLYVCNEVLQTSKRNRGNRFLEAYSPVLGQALRHMAQVVQDPGLVEKIRRTVKIWGDRRVFSIRYVNELLTGLEPYRHGRKPPAAAAAVEENSFAQTGTADGNNTNEVDKKSNNNNNNKKSEDDEIMDILEGNDDSSVGGGGGGGRGGGGNNDHNNNNSNSDNDDDDDDLFGDSSERSKLQIEINVDQVAASNLAAVANKEAAAAAAKKRGRRGSMESTGSNSKRRKVTKSIANLLELWNQLSDLQQKYDLAILTLKRMEELPPADTLEHLVGDELLAAKQQNDANLLAVAEQRAILHQTAIERHALEQQITQYLPWLENALQQDDTDIAFCETLSQSLQHFQPIHAQIVSAKNILTAEQEEQRRLEQERERKRREAEENERFRRAALAKETEAKPGMVWNPSTREYQALNTDESWRD